MTTGSGWQLIESDPAVFTHLIAELGIKGVQAEEIYTVDQHEISNLDPFGVVFCFKYQGTDEGMATGRGTLDFDHDVWFSVQVVQNACASQAILAILLNTNLDLGKELSLFKDFTSGLPYELRGEAMGNSERIRTVHNSFARSQMFSIEDDISHTSTAEAPFHFIAYSVINGYLYELDGLKAAPVNHGMCAKAQAGEKLESVLRARIARYPENEIQFSLLGLVKDRLTDAHQRLSPEDEHIELGRREIWRKEIELRKFNFAGAILQTVTEIVRRKTLRTDIESWCLNARH